VRKASDRPKGLTDILKRTRTMPRLPQGTSPRREQTTGGISGAKKFGKGRFGKSRGKRIVAAERKDQRNQGKYQAEGKKEIPHPPQEKEKTRSREKKARDGRKEKERNWEGDIGTRIFTKSRPRGRQKAGRGQENTSTYQRGGGGDGKDLQKEEEEKGEGKRTNPQEIGEGSNFLGGSERNEVRARGRWTDNSEGGKRNAI